MRYNREKTLFVTDMDGTILGPDSQLSPYTVEVLREVVSRGFNITAASGRMPESPKRIFEEHDIELHLPIIGRNGVLVYDSIQSEYLKIHKISRESVAHILGLIQKNGAQLFLVDTVENGRPKMTRRGAAVFSELIGDLGETIYVAADGSFEQLAPIYEQALRLPGIGGLLIHEETISENWCAEFFNEKASKGNGVRFVMERYNFSYSVCFGDNKNDLSMFTVCDEAYVPENAAPEVGAAASAIIGPNTADGVARWLEENLLG